MKKLIFPILLLFLYSCSSITVTSDYDREVDFTTYKTFSLLKWRDGNNVLVNEFDKRRLEVAVANEMVERGYTFAKTGGELAISIFVILEDKTSYTAYTDYYGGYGYYYGAPWGWGGPERTSVHQYDYTQGTIIFNVFDAAQKKLIWQGTAIGEVDNYSERREENVRKGVAEVFARFPITK